MMRSLDDLLQEQANLVLQATSLRHQIAAHKIYLTLKREAPDRRDHERALDRLRSDRVPLRGRMIILQQAIQTALFDEVPA